MSGLKERFDRSTTAQVVLIFLLALPIAFVSRLYEEGEPVWRSLLRAVAIGATGAVLFAARQRRYRRRVGGRMDALVAAERRFRRGEVPEDHAEREAMRGLLAERRREMARVWAIAVFLGMLTLLPVLFLLNGEGPAAAVALVVGALFGGWMLWMRRRNLRRLDHMEKALGRSPDTRAFTH
ncbi:flippase-like domain-containing protein [Streptomyces sp. TRM66268-LWL]|uniref:Flippase-like domain-containing protein n=1 Tax=Streptomyces polyasparticus TaxID=2767826 RepID=A0ABR7SFM2_9ACTN|nr:lysylphosphatidylglycerol synthase domain-containing protein [Streptomyces polyasparticus]MBC9713168.1 flippase-like domain-containing protein [Streptomyces polyasparticus]